MLTFLVDKILINPAHNGFKFDLPGSGNFLAAQEQGDQIAVWYELTGQERGVTQYVMYWTGVDIHSPTTLFLAYLTTIQCSKNGLVWHLYKRIPQTTHFEV